MFPVEPKLHCEKEPISAHKPKNPDHHLWNNHGTWWLHYTMHLPDYTKRRIRKSLGTHNVEEARQRRDEILATMML